MANPHDNVAVSFGAVGYAGQRNPTLGSILALVLRCYLGPKPRPAYHPTHHLFFAAGRIDRWEAPV